MKPRKSVGVVRFNDYCLEQDFILECGLTLFEINVRYECYGRLAPEKNNAILVIHALTGNHHAAGWYQGNIHHKGWWEEMIGPGKALDTDKYFVVCSNNLGGCSGTTGPNSANPTTGKIYATNFPMITVMDMVRVQLALKNHLGISKFHTVIGGSMGGVLALYWSVYFPDQVERVVSIASTASQNAQSIAFSEVARQAIMRDPHWQGGQYLLDQSEGRKLPNDGLSIARMLAHITYLSDRSMKKKFGRRLQKDKIDFTFDPEFKVEGYLRYQGAKFTDQFDANSYIYITKALNYADLSRDFSSLKEAFSCAQADYLVITFSSDWLYPPYMGEHLIEGILRAGKRGSYAEIETEAGHDAFLLEWEKITLLIEHFFLDVCEKDD